MLDRLSISDLPPGVTDRDVSGDTSLQLFTIEVVVRLTVPARDGDAAIEQALDDLGEPSNARILRSDVFDSEPLN